MAATAPWPRDKRDGKRRRWQREQAQTTSDMSFRPFVCLFSYVFFLILTIFTASKHSNIPDKQDDCHDNRDKRGLETHRVSSLRYFFFLFKFFFLLGYFFNRYDMSSLTAPWLNGAPSTFFSFYFLTNIAFELAWTSSFRPFYPFNYIYFVYFISELFLPKIQLLLLNLLEQDPLLPLNSNYFYIYL